MSDCYESMSRTPIRDRLLQQPLIGHSRHPFVIPAPRFVIPDIKSMPRTPIRGRNPEGWGEGIVALRLVPRLGRAASSPALHHPAPSHFHPLMRPSQGHGDSCENRFPPPNSSSVREHVRFADTVCTAQELLIQHSPASLRHSGLLDSSLRRSKACLRTPIRGRSPGVGEGKCSAGACPQLRARR